MDQQNISIEATRYFYWTQICTFVYWTTQVFTLNRPGTQIFCEPLQSFRLFALLQSSAGFSYLKTTFTIMFLFIYSYLDIFSGKFWRTCSLTSSKRRQAWFTSGRSTSPTTALLGPTGIINVYQVSLIFINYYQYLSSIIDIYQVLLIFIKYY